MLDVGSLIVNIDALTFRSLLDNRPVRYIRLKIGLGLNVDFVPVDSCSSSETPDGNVEVIIFGQAFEHISYSWITASEMSRVL